MRSVNDIKSLGDVKSAISSHARAMPRLKGSTYLDVFLLDKERQRLETELAMLDKRKRRIEQRVAEIQQAMEKMISRAQAASAAGAGESAGEPSAPATSRETGPGAWRTLSIEY